MENQMLTFNRGLRCKSIHAEVNFSTGERFLVELPDNFSFRQAICACGHRFYNHEAVYEMFSDGDLWRIYRDGIPYIVIKPYTPDDGWDNYCQ